MLIIHAVLRDLLASAQSRTDSRYYPLRASASLLYSSVIYMIIIVYDIIVQYYNFRKNYNIILLAG